MKIFTKLTNTETKLINGGGCPCFCTNRAEPLITSYNGYEIIDQTSNTKFIGLVASPEICKIKCSPIFFDYTCTSGNPDLDTSMQAKSSESFEQKSSAVLLFSCPDK